MKRLHIPLFAIIAVIAASCYPSVERVPLMAYQKQMIPYQKGQKVCFTDAKGDTSLFTTTDITTEWNWDETALVKIWLQIYKVTLQSESDEQISLRMGAYSYDYFVLNDYYNRIYLRLKGFHFCLPFDCAGKFHTHATDEYTWDDDPMSLNNKWHVYDSLSINDRMYYDVVEENNKNGQLYYNKTYGVLQLRQNGKDILTLQQ